MKIRLHSYDGELPLDKVLNFSVLNIVVISVFQIENKYYPRIHIHECEYECEYESKKIWIAFLYLFLETYFYL